MAEINDLVLLKALSSKDTYSHYHNLVQYSVLEPEIQQICKDFGSYFAEFDCDHIHFSEFATWFFQFKHPELTDVKREIYGKIFSNLPSIEPPTIKQVLLKFKEKSLIFALRELLDKGFSYDKLSELCIQFEDIAKELEQDDADVVLNNLDTILEVSQHKDGLSWRLNALNETIGPLNRGKFIIIAAYVDVGKTTLAASEATFMARQLTEGTILWLNNEEDDYRVWRKLWKATLGCNDAALIENRHKAEAEFKKRMGGDLNRIKLVNIRNKNFTQIKKLFTKYQPKLVVIDQIDKINNSTYKAFSDHDRLKNLYGEVRGLANEFCPIIAISQADATTMWMDKLTKEVEYQLYPHHRQLDGSKVGKPGEADAIIMVGRRAESSTTRGLHISKNKFGDTLKAEVIFNGDICRYENP